MVPILKATKDINFADVIKYLKENSVTNVRVDLSRINPKQMNSIIKLVTSEKEFFEENKIQLDNCLVQCDTIAEIDSIVSCFHDATFLIGAEENEYVEPMDLNTYKLVRKELESIVEGISLDLPRIKRFEIVYTRLGKKISYDDKALEEGTEYSKKVFKSCRNLIGPLLYGKGVCAGLSEAVKQTCSLVEVPCKYVISKEKEGECHAYNIVEFLVGKWGNVDLTNDYQLICDEHRFGHALQSDEDFRSGNLEIFHTPEDNQKIPRCQTSVELSYPESELSDNSRIIIIKAKSNANFADMLEFLKENNITNMRMDLSEIDSQQMDSIIKLATSEKEFFEENKIQIDNCLVQCDTIAEIDSIVSCFYNSIFLIGAEENKNVQPMDLNTYRLVRKKLESIVKDIPTDWTREDKFREVYTRLKERISCDNKAREDTEYNKKEHESSGNIMKSLFQGEWSDEGVAETLKQTCSLLGVPCKYVTGGDGKGAYNIVEFEPGRYKTINLENEIRIARKEQENWKKKRKRFLNYLSFTPVEGKNSRRRLDKKQEEYQERYGQDGENVI